ncbi:hypothetical protein SCOCK_530023 [Actinacidiphila cocklensis]|uniref:Uncharacterized protein n=1 Tax=Actinacidiphila cocklensis TaxID=887465 RepID=A0A9W4E1I1_9ACTN|nr:hypothetical protein SCOCK_530023 [Actinacidiphila cocklensis]
MLRRYGYAGHARGTGGTGGRGGQRRPGRREPRGPCRARPPARPRDPGADGVRPFVPRPAGHRRRAGRRDRPRQRPRHPPAPGRRRAVAAAAAGGLRPRAAGVHRLLRPGAAGTRPPPGDRPRRADRDGLHPPADPQAAGDDRPRHGLPPGAHPGRGAGRLTSPGPPGYGSRHSMLPLRHPNVDAVQCLAGQTPSPGANVTGVIRPGRGN